MNVIGTGLLILMTTSDGFLGKYSSEFMEKIGLFGGVHKDFTPQW